MEIVKAKSIHEVAEKCETLCSGTIILREPLCAVKDEWICSLLKHTSSPYFSSKAGADLLVQAYYRSCGLPVIISRCSNNYGSYHFSENLIPLMIANALADKPLPESLSVTGSMLKTIIRP